MPLEILRGDITRLRVDAIVNAANTRLLGGSGVDGAIHRAAGPELLEACRKIGGCPVGESRLTPGFRLPARYVIHTVGPIWRGGGYDEERLLASCYRRSLEIAEERGFESIAFPLISSGAFGYPKAEALRVATDAIRLFLSLHEIQVYLVIFDRDSFNECVRRYGEIHAFIDDEMAEAACAREPSRRLRQIKEIWHAAPLAHRAEDSVPMNAPLEASTALGEALSQDTGDLRAFLNDLDAGFSDTLLRLIDRQGITDVECYKRANISRKVFSKIRSNPDYRPSKNTAVAFGLALRLSEKELEEFLARAGYALSPASKADLIVRWYVRQGQYDILEINEALFAFDQALLGAS